MLAAQRELAIYHLPENVGEPGFENFAHGVIGLLNQQIESVEYDVSLTASSDLLTGVPMGKRDHNAVAFFRFGGVAKGSEEESMKNLFTLTDAEQGATGDVVAIADYIEGRDDRRRKNDGKKPPPYGSPHLEYYLRKLRAATQRPVAAYALIDGHSGATIEGLRNLHAKDGQENTPVFPLTPIPLIARDWKDRGLVDETAVVLSSDLGFAEKGMVMSEELDAPLVIATKSRPKDNEAEIDEYYLYHRENGKLSKLEDGFFKGKTVFVGDDIIDTGGTLIGNLKKIQQGDGVRAIYCGISHGVFGPRTPDKAKSNIIGALDSGVLDGLTVTDTLPTHATIQHPKIRTVSMQPVVASLIRMLAHKETEEDRALVKKCLFYPQLNKERLNAHFSEMQIPYDRSADEKAFATIGTVFKRPQPDVEEPVSIPLLQGQFFFQAE